MAGTPRKVTSAGSSYTSSNRPSTPSRVTSAPLTPDRSSLSGFERKGTIANAIAQARASVEFKRPLSFDRAPPSGPASLAEPSRPFTPATALRRRLEPLPAAVDNDDRDWPIIHTEEDWTLSARGSPAASPSPSSSSLATQSPASSASRIPFRTATAGITTNNGPVVATSRPRPSSGTNSASSSTSVTALAARARASQSPSPSPPPTRTSPTPNTGSTSITTSLSTAPLQASAPTTAASATAALQANTSPTRRRPLRPSSSSSSPTQPPVNGGTSLVNGAPTPAYAIATPATTTASSVTKPTKTTSSTAAARPSTPDGAKSAAAVASGTEEEESIFGLIAATSIAVPLARPATALGGQRPLTAAGVVESEPDSRHRHPPSSSSSSSSTSSSLTTSSSSSTSSPSSSSMKPPRTAAGARPTTSAGAPPLSPRSSLEQIRLIQQQLDTDAKHMDAAKTYATAYRCLSAVTTPADIAAVATVIMRLPVDPSGEKACLKCYKKVFELSADKSQDAHVTPLISLLVASLLQARQRGLGQTTFVLAALRNISLEENNLATLETAGAIQSLSFILNEDTLVELKANDDDTKIRLLMQATSILRQLSLLSSHSTIFRTHDCLPLLTSLLIRYPGNATLMLNVCRILSKLSLHASCRATISSNQAHIRALVGFCLTYHNKLALCVRVCFILGNLTVTNDEHRLTIFNHCDGLSVLMGSLRRTYERDLKLARKKVAALEEEKRRQKKKAASGNAAGSAADDEKKGEEASATARTARRSSVEKGRISDITAYEQHH